jgi:hypothetical protein
MSLNHKPKTVFITGFQKNCGKTTFLNYLLSKCPQGKNVFCASVGVDNIKPDFLNTDFKPQLKIKKGWSVLTNTEFLKTLLAPYKIMDIIDSDVMGAKPCIISPLIDSYIRLSSCGTNSQTYNLITEKAKKSDIVYIDGAFDRITQLSLFDDSEFFYVFKVSTSNIETVIEKILYLESMRDITVKIENRSFINNMSDDIVVHGDTLYLKGALTYSKIDMFDEKIKKIVISDFTKIFLSYRDWIKFTTRYKVFFTSEFNFCGYVINLYDIKGNDFSKKFDKKVYNRFIYNPYEYRKIL